MENIAAACRDQGIEEVVICPGSRNAPLTISLVRSGAFQCTSIIDERSAAFIAMGKAIATRKPVVLVCTSGTAAANFYPAVIEAFYLRVPLLILTADRPPELIDQWDGQTIHQEDIYGDHVKSSWNLPADYTDTELFYQTTQEALTIASAGIQGPVHINVPLREPLYPKEGYSVNLPNSRDKASAEEIETESFAIDLEGKRVLVICGMDHSEEEKELPQGLAVFRDRMANKGPGHTLSEQVFMTSTFQDDPELCPEVILSTGGPILSKTIKQYLRQATISEHYHFSVSGDIADPFQSNPQLIRADLFEVLSGIRSTGSTAYVDRLNELDSRCRRMHENLLTEAGSSEFSIIQEAVSRISKDTVLHLGNSMPVRYAAYCDPHGGPVYCNRGTSGIDGCVSTAVGMVSGDNREHLLIVGDVAFFYDSNALWNEVAKSNLKILVMNNSGGGIFGLINGPSQQAELDTFFMTEHQRNAKDHCSNLGIPYFSARQIPEFQSAWDTFAASSTCAVLEVFTNKAENQLFFRKYKEAIHGI